MPKYVKILKPGELYFIDYENFIPHLEENSLIAEVEIPKGTKIYKKNNNKLISNKIILSNIISVRELEEWDDEKFQLDAVNINIQSLNYINNPSLKVQLAAVKKDGFAIKLINNPSLEVKMEAVRENKDVFWIIENPEPELYKIASEEYSNLGIGFAMLYYFDRFKKYMYKLFE
jgi:hypothetical protein